jgi:hypothetical protein
MGGWRDRDWSGGLRRANGGVQQLLETLLRRSGLKHPDGRPLHRYAPTDCEIEELGKLLRAALRREPDGSAQYVGGAFCLFVACWFQRYGGTSPWSWEEPGNALEVPLDHVLRTHLTGAGLFYWHRPLRKRDDGTTLYLASLIVEGGLPKLALARPGWLGSYLGRVIADLERGRQVDVETASRHALFHLHHVPEAFRDECLAELMSATALAIADLRRKASERPAGVDPVQWLNTVEADWRTSFPIQIEDSTVAQLIEGLVRNANAPPPETQLI